MIVFRIESQDGTGPYYEMHKRPGPLMSTANPCWERWDDYPTDDDYFGFATLTQALKWFTPYPDDLKMITDAGFALVIFSVPNTLVKTDRAQCIFKRKSPEVRVIDNLPPAALLDPDINEQINRIIAA